MLSESDDIYQVENDAGKGEENHDPAESVLHIMWGDPISEETHHESKKRNEYLIHEFYVVFQLRI